MLLGLPVREHRASAEKAVGMYLSRYRAYFMYALIYERGEA